eukprot:TRINITY_DN4530_c0_g1_i5.p1 TRINITY_DN4530_c0_g1~~TRINITY_DN4530_c0_g1_i5.p1  ORF type:complete len:864 (+),score=274.73 TRINITY_DN4530_c0_g1_i5:144-2735(+)
MAEAAPDCCCERMTKAEAKFLELDTEQAGFLCRERLEDLAQWVYYSSLKAPGSEQPLGSVEVAQEASKLVSMLDEDQNGHVGFEQFQGYFVKRAAQQLKLQSMIAAKLGRAAPEQPKQPLILHPLCPSHGNDVMWMLQAVVGSEAEPSPGAPEAASRASQPAAETAPEAGTETSPAADTAETVHAQASETAHSQDTAAETAPAQTTPETPPRRCRAGSLEAMPADTSADFGAMMDEFGSESPCTDNPLKSPRRHQRSSSLEVDPSLLVNPRESFAGNNAGLSIKLRDERQKWEAERQRFMEEIENTKQMAQKTTREANEFKELSIMLQDKVDEGETKQAAMMDTMRSLFDLSPALEMASDRHTKIREFNRTAEGWTGRERSAVIGKKLIDALGVDPKDKVLVKKIATMVKSASSGTGPAEQLQVSINGNDAVLLSVAPWLGSNGTVVGAAITGTKVAAAEPVVDVSSIQEALTAAERIAADKSEALQLASAQAQQYQASLQQSEEECQGLRTVLKDRQEELCRLQSAPPTTVPSPVPSPTEGSKPSSVEVQYGTDLSRLESSEQACEHLRELVRQSQQELDRLQEAEQQRDHQRASWKQTQFEILSVREEHGECSKLRELLEQSQCQFESLREAEDEAERLQQLFQATQKHLEQLRDAEVEALELRKCVSVGKRDLDKIQSLELECGELRTAWKQSQQDLESLRASERECVQLRAQLEGQRSPGGSVRERGSEWELHEAVRSSRLELHKLQSSQVENRKLREAMWRSKQEVQEILQAERECAELRREVHLAEGHREGMLTLLSPTAKRRSRPEQLRMERSPKSSPRAAKASPQIVHAYEPLRSPTQFLGELEAFSPGLSVLYI